MTRGTFLKAVPAVIAGFFEVREVSKSKAEGPRWIVGGPVRLWIPGYEHLKMLRRAGVPRLLAYVDAKERDVFEKPWIPRRVVLDARDVSHICFRAELYSDGSGKCFCYKVRNGDHVLTPDRSNVETEVLTGGHIEITFAEPYTEYWKLINMASSNGTTSL